MKEKNKTSFVNVVKKNLCLVLNVSNVSEEDILKMSKQSLFIYVEGSIINNIFIFK